MEKLLTIKDVAHLLGLSTRTIAKWVKTGQIQSVKVYRSRRFRQEDIQKLYGKPTRY